MFVMKPSMNDIEKRKMLSEVALGNAPPDTVITHGVLFNVFTGEFIRGQSIWIKDGMIAYVGPDHDPCKGEESRVIDADGMVLLPGLIDGHTHIISNRSGIEEFIKHVIPGGTTTLVTELMEFAPIVGKDGIEYVVKGLEKQPIRCYHTIPSLCGLTPSEEINAPTNEELLPLLKDPQCLGVGEIYWGNIFLKGRQGERVRELVSMALGLGKTIEGHSAGAKGRKLQAYTCFGVSSCHEPINEDEILERLRLGYSVMIREGSVRKELDGIRDIFRRKIDFRRLILATDGVDPEGFLEEGYLDAGLKRALKLGVSPGLVYQMATINVAEHFRIDHLIGSLSPGMMADMVIIPSPNDFSPKLVMCDGKIIYRESKLMVEPKKIFFPEYMFHTVKVRDDYFRDGALAEPAKALAKVGKARVMELVTRLVTQEKIIDLEIPGELEDVITILVLDRVGRGEAFMGLLKGYGLRKGAYGSTMCWDVTDMIVVGCDTRSIETVIERLKEIGGGGVYAVGEEVVAEFPAPLCGLVSLKSMEVVREEVRQVEKCLRENGVRWEKPMLTIDTLGTPAIPHLRITHQGYVRLRDHKILTLEV
jgi:adenine deaminase